MPACALAAALFSGCSTLHKVWPHGHKPKAAVAQRPLWVGSISLVNEGSHFVLVDNGDLVAPEIGSVLKSFNHGTETGELRATEFRRRPFIIADVVRGTPRKGDRVMALPAASRTAAAGEANVQTARAQAVEPPTPKRSWWKVWPFGRRA